MDIEQRVKNILLDILDIDEEQIVPTASLRSDLGASSVDLVEIIAALENEFDLDIPDSEAQSVRTVGAIIEYVQRKTAA